MRGLPHGRALVAAALLAFLSCSTAAGGRISLRPVLGDWEGVGPHGLPLSFTLAHELIRIGGQRRDLVVMRDLVVAYPTSCPQAQESSQAFAYPRAEYTGPGAPPVTFRFKRPDQFEIYIASAPGFDVGLGFFLQGRLLGARRGVVSEPVFHGALTRCGWPAKTLTWRLHASRRVKVADGTWKGTPAAPSVATGTVSAKVGADGRTVDRFRIDLTCSDGAASSLEFVPALHLKNKPTSEFISSSGSFKGSGANVNGVQLGWRGRFGSDGLLRGTFVDVCGGDTASLSGSFTARRTGP